MARPNFTVIGNAVAQRVIFEGKRAVGVETLVNGEPQTFHGEEIVISAGALRTPQILMLSGVGPADHLGEFGIPVVQDLPGVGQSLTDHPAARAAWNCDVELKYIPGRSNSTSLLHWRGADGSDIEIIPGIVRVGDMMGVSNRPGHPAAPVSPSVASVPELAFMPENAFVYITVQQEESRGTVALRSANPQDAPAISFNLLSEAVDRARLREGVRVAHELFQSDPMKQIGAKLLDLDASHLKADASLDKWIAAGIGAVHPSCSCRMGPSSDPTAVVDQYLRVYGVDGLRVADTSIYPNITSRGPNATAVMVGDRLADFLA